MRNSTSNQDATSLALSQKRASLISAVVITFLLLVIFLTILYLINFTLLHKGGNGIISYQSGQPNESTRIDEVVEDEVQSDPLPVQTDVSKIITAELLVDSPLPTLSEPTTDFNLDLEETEPVSVEGWGNDTDLDESLTDSASGGWVSLPKSQSARCSKKARLHRLKKFGGTKQCETAVVKSLQWLKNTQNDNGSWGEYKQVGFTGLALLCYLGHCETPQSPEFGETVERAILYLLSSGVENEGKMASDYNQRSWPYEHAIATYALAETYTLIQQYKLEIPNLKTVLTQAANHIVDSQHEFSGGWDYSYSTDSDRGGDSSLVCWHLQALKACKLTKIAEIQNLGRPARKGLEFLRSCQRKSGGIHYYPSHFKPTNPDYATMTGAAILCYQQWGKHDHQLVNEAMKYAQKDMGFRYSSPNSDLYKHYYYAQAFINKGGATWRTYNQQFRKALLSNQNLDGSWKAPGGGKKIEGTHTKAYASGSKSAQHYRTCLATLMLEVYYRYLPTK